MAACDNYNVVVTKLARAISMKDSLLVCVLWPFRNKTTDLRMGLHASGSVRSTLQRCGIASILSRALLRLMRGCAVLNDQTALMQISTVTSCPVSADDSEPICFFPRLAIILDGRLGTVVIPVSSTS